MWIDFCGEICLKEGPKFFLRIVVIFNIRTFFELSRISGQEYMSRAIPLVLNFCRIIFANTSL